MLFPRRTWALRVTERMGLGSRSREATLLVDLLIWSAKQEQQLLQQFGMPTLTKAEGILMGGLTMINNRSAVSRIAQELGRDNPSTVALLKKMQEAAISLIVEFKFESLEALARRRLEK